MEIITMTAARESGLPRYFTGKPCKNGHTVERYVSTRVCVLCMKAHSAAHYQENADAILTRTKERRLLNPGAERDREKRYREQNKKSIKARMAAYYISNRESILARTAEYRRLNRERANAWSAKSKRKHAAKVSRYVSDYMRRRSAVDPVYALRRQARVLVSMALFRRGYRKHSSTELIIGCSWPEFAAHIERQFLPGMTWENRALWHIDHIVALATAKTEADVLALNHFTNLRPLWKPDNLKKGAKQTHLI